MRLKFLNHEVYSVHAAALLLGAAGLFSRLLGVLRDRLLAGHFGAGRELDIYYAAFQIPDFMSILFLLGAASAAILPIFQEYLARDKDQARNLISDATSIFLYGSLAASFFLFLLLPTLAKFIVPGFSTTDRSLTVLLSRIMLLSPVLLGLSGIFSSVVQSFQRFFVYALAPVLYNLGIIMGILFLVPILGIKGLAVGVAAGALLHFGLNWGSVKSLGFAPQWWRWHWSEGIKSVFKLSFPRVLSVSLSQITMVVLVAIASNLSSGSISVLQLSQNLYFVPIGIFGFSYSTVVFPRLSRAYINFNARDFFHELFGGMRLILFWILPFSILFIVLRAHIVRATLGAGVFSWEDTRLTAAVLAVLAIAMFSDALVSLLIRGFYALENTWMPLIINIAASSLSIASAYFFSKALASPGFFSETVGYVLRLSDIRDSRVIGLALGFSLGSLVDIWLLYWALKTFAQRRFEEKHFFPLRDVLKIIIASFLAGIIAYLVRLSFAKTLPLITLVEVLSQGMVAGAIGMAVYFGALIFMREEDMTGLWTAFRHRLFRIGILPPSWDGETHLHHS